MADVERLAEIVIEYLTHHDTFRETFGRMHSLDVRLLQEEIADELHARYPRHESWW